MAGRQVTRWELESVTGPVVVVDVIRAFTTAAYAFGAGAEAIYLVAGVDEALQFAAARPGVLAMGENHGRRPDGFDFPNSPAMVSRADLTGRTLVQRTSAGTQGVVGALSASRLWAASLACASATARAVEAAGLGDPTYVITGYFADRPTPPATTTGSPPTSSNGHASAATLTPKRLREHSSPPTKLTGRLLWAEQYVN